MERSRSKKLSLMTLRSRFLRGPVSFHNTANEQTPAMDFSATLERLRSQFHQVSLNDTELSFAKSSTSAYAFVGESLDRNAEEWPFDPRTPTGRPAALPSKISDRTILYVAFGVVSWVDGVTNQHPVTRHTPIFLAPVTFDPKARLLRRIHKSPSDLPAPNTPFIRWLSDSRRITAAIDTSAPTASAFTCHDPDFQFENSPDCYLGAFLSPARVLAESIDPTINPHILASPGLSLTIGHNIPDTYKSDPVEVDLSIFTKLDPDQAAALTTATSGQSFVLTGPPGCGKSEVISRIATAFARAGRSVVISAPINQALKSVRERTKQVDEITYIDSGSAPEFDTCDIVIYDEASRLTTAQAIPIAARARQLIIVGDPKQMTAPDNAPKIDEMDQSLIERHLALGVLPILHLRYHHRSQHNELIRYSNQVCYRSSLRLVPPAKRPPRSGNMIASVVDGYLEKRLDGYVNPVEADKLALHVIKAFLNDRGTGLKRSRMIIAMTPAQKAVICHAIARHASNNGIAVDDLSPNKNEQFLILDSSEVQGLERDEVYLSITFASCRDGTIPSTFPALESGATKRLNVLMSRARYATHLYHSIKIHQLSDSPSHQSLTTLLHILRLNVNARFALAERPKLQAFATRVAGDQFRHHYINEPRTRDLGVVHGVRGEDDPKGTYVFGIVIPPSNRPDILDMLTKRDWKIIQAEYVQQHRRYVIIRRPTEDP